MIQILGAHRMRMQLEAGEIGQPGQRGGVARHDFVRAAAGGELEGDDLDPRRAGGRRPLLVEELLADAVGIAHQHVGPAAGAAQRAFGDSEVVVHQVELGVLRRRGRGPSADWRWGPRGRRPRRSRGRQCPFCSRPCALWSFSNGASERWFGVPGERWRRHALRALPGPPRMSGPATKGEVVACPNAPCERAASTARPEPSGQSAAG